MDGRLKMLALAGAEEIGMNMTVYSYEFGEKTFSILVDCGVAFEDLPGASVAMPDVKILKTLGIKINAIIITHGHEDHIGALPYLLDEFQVPIYATPFTAALIRKKMDYIGKKNFHIIEVHAKETHEIGAFSIQWINATHSIPDNTMLAITAGKINVLHTGDWKDDPNPLVGLSTDFDSIKEFAKKGIHALVSDSTNIHEENEAVSEATVAQALKDLVKKTKTGKFVLTCFASNVARIKGCFEAAEASGRKILILGSSLKKSVEISINLGYLKDYLLVDEGEAQHIAPQHLMILSTGSQAEENSALWKMANDMRSVGSSLEPGDTLVFSARVIDGRQKAVRKVINTLVEKGVRIIHPWNSESCIHASGHPSRPDIEKLLNIVKPNYVIPVHSEAEHRMSHIAFAIERGFKAFNLRNGMLIEINPKEVIDLKESIQTNKLVVDGVRLVSQDSEIFIKRRELNNSGIINIAIGTKNKKVFSLISSFGVFDKLIDEKIKSNFKRALDKEVNGFTVEQLKNSEMHNNIKKKLITNLKRYVLNTMKKKPIVAVQILV